MAYTPMTSRERLLSAIAHGRPDRVPVGPFGLGRLDHGGKVAAELIAKTDPFIPVGIGGNAFMGQLVETESVQEGNDTVTTIFTPKGNLTQRRRRTYITSYMVEFACKNAEDVGKYLSIPYKPSEPNVDAFLTRRDEIGEEGLAPQEYASRETIKRISARTGAKFILVGAIKSTTDKIQGAEVVYYQTDLEMINTKTLTKVWVGTRKITKEIPRKKPKS